MMVSATATKKATAKKSAPKKSAPKKSAPKKKATPVAVGRNVPQAVNEWPRVHIYKGERHTLAQVDGGFCLDGKGDPYKTITGAAFALTNPASVSGHVFWGFGTGNGPKMHAEQRAPRTATKKATSSKKSATKRPATKKTTAKRAGGKKKSAAR